METGMNTLQRSYKIYNFTLSPDKTKRTWNNTFWSQSSRYFIIQQQEWVYELSELFFLQFVFKMSAFCTDTRRQLTSPLINSSVSNVLFNLN